MFISLISDLHFFRCASDNFAISDSSVVIVSSAKGSLLNWPMYSLSTILIPKIYCVLHPLGILCLDIYFTRFMN